MQRTVLKPDNFVYRHLKLSICDTQGIFLTEIIILLELFLFECFKALILKGLISYLCLHYCLGRLWWCFRTDKGFLKMDSYVQSKSDKIMIRLKQLLQYSIELFFFFFPFKWALELQRYQGNCSVAMPLITQNSY